MTPKAVRLAQRLAHGGTFTVLAHFDRGPRQMRFTISAKLHVRFAKKSHLPYILVWDLDREGWRTLPLDKVTQLTEQHPDLLHTLAEANAHMIYA